MRNNLQRVDKHPSRQQCSGRAEWNHQDQKGDYDPSCSAREAGHLVELILGELVEHLDVEASTEANCDIVSTALKELSAPESHVEEGCGWRFTDEVFGVKNDLDPEILFCGIEHVPVQLLVLLVLSDQQDFDSFPDFDLLAAVDGVAQCVHRQTTASHAFSDHNLSWR